MSAQPERQQQDPNEALRARLEQLSPEQRRVVAERIATLQQQLRNASPGVLAQLRERLQPSPPQEVRVGPPGVITTTSATVATPDVAAPEAGKVVDVSALLDRYKELLSRQVYYRSVDEKEELKKLPYHLSRSFGLTGEEGVELLEAEETKYTRLENSHLSVDVITGLLRNSPNDIYPLLQALPNIIPLAQAYETAHKAWIETRMDSDEYEEWLRKKRDTETNLKEALVQTVEAEVGPMQFVFYGYFELDALESAIKAEPQDEETIKAALATRNKARLERLRRGNNNMTRWNSFFEKRLDAIGKAIKPAEDILEDNIGIIDKPAKAPPAAFAATPTAQEATKPAAAALVPEQKPAGGLTLTFRNVPTFTKALGLQRALQTLDGVHEARAVGFEKGVLSITLDYDPAKVQSINEAIRELLNEKRKYESWDVQASRVEEEQT